MKNTSCFIILALAGFASADLISRETTAGLQQLVSRQSAGSEFPSLSPSDVPAECQSQCTPMITTLNGCQTSTDLSCGCSTQTKDQLTACFGCLVGIVPSLQSSMDTAEQAFTEGCKAAGKDVGTASGSGASGSSNGSANGGNLNQGLTTTGGNAVAANTQSAAQAAASADPYAKNSASSLQLGSAVLTAAAAVFAIVL